VPLRGRGTAAAAAAPSGRTACQRPRYVAGIRPASRHRESHTDLSLLLPGLATGDEQRIALKVMIHILGGGASSRLFQTVRATHGLCYAISAEHEHFEDIGSS
jgi:predicted Zn-dependent peptidase